MGHVFQALATGLAWLTAAAAAPAAAPPAASPAPPVEQQWTSCKNQDGRLAADSSIAACTAVIESGRVQGRNLSIAYQARGNIYDDNGRYAEAMADYEQAIRLNPQSAMAYYNRGLSLRRQGKIDLALADSDKSIELDPAYAPAFNNRGNLRALKGRYAEAIADYREALRLRPGMQGAQANLCVFLVIAGSDLATAGTECDTALRIVPNDHKVIGARGMLGLRQGRFQQAWDEYDRAICLAPPGTNITGFLYGRGIAASRLGRKEDARADLDRATAMAPTIARQFADIGLTPAR